MHTACSLFLAQVTSKASFAAALNDVMYIHHPTEPGMPWIKHLYGLGHMGLAPFVCITTSDCTRPCVTAPRAFEEAMQFTKLRRGRKTAGANRELAAQ
jgi:hypothetical protein